MRYAKIAAHAQALGRPRLATLLLEHETRAGEQVNPNVMSSICKVLGLEADAYLRC